MTERRSEPRVPVNDLPIQIWGTDNYGMPFMQQAFARNLSVRGALLVGIEHELRSGDLIGVQHQGKRARYRIIWIGFFAGGRNLTEIAIHKLDGDECPWKEELFRQASAAE